MKEELRLFLTRLLPFILIIVGIPLISYLIWFFTPDQSIGILVIDKTVRDKTYLEHQGVFWTLEHSKIQTPSGEYYDRSKDYLGFFPNGKETRGEKNDLAGKSKAYIDSLVAKNDLIFLADTYGVFEKDFELETFEK